MSRKFPLALIAAIVTLALPFDSEARRVGGGGSSSAARHSSSEAGGTVNKNISVNLGGRGASGGTGSGVAGAVAAGAAGAVVGNAVAKALSPEEEKKIADQKAEEERLAKIVNLDRQVDEETRKANAERYAAKLAADKATAERAEQERKEKAENDRLARLERERLEEQQRKDREKLCVIRPVMSDAAIALCKEVWR